MQYLGAISVQNDRMILVHFQSEPFNITVIQAHAPVTNAEQAEVELFYKEVQASGINIKKRCTFHHRELECKSRKSSDTWSLTGKFCLGTQNEAGQRLPEFCRDNTLVIANTLFWQCKRWLYTWTSPDGQYWNQIDYILHPRVKPAAMYTVSLCPERHLGHLINLNLLWEYPKLMLFGNQ